MHNRLPTAGEPAGPVFPSVQGSEQLAEPLHLEHGLLDLAAPVGGPERLVDAAVHGEDVGRRGQAVAREGGAQGAALGPVEVEKGAVEVEEDGPDP